MPIPPDSAPDALDADEKKNNPWLFWGPLLAAIGFALIPVAVLALPLLLIALLKSRRRKARFQRRAPPLCWPAVPTPRSSAPASRARTR